MYNNRDRTTGRSTLARVREREARLGCVGPEDVRVSLGIMKIVRCTSYVT